MGRNRLPWPWPVYKTCWLETERDVRKRLKNIGTKERQRAYERYIEERSRNHSCREKTINITYSMCVSGALLIQHAKRKCHIMMIYDMWYDMIYDTIYIWYDMICDLWYMIWYEYDDIWWYDITWYDMIWYDTIWYVCYLQLGWRSVAVV